MLTLTILVHFTALSLLAHELYRGTRHAVLQRAFSPILLFHLNFAMFALLPASCIFFSESWESTFFSLDRFGNLHATLGVSVFYLLAIIPFRVLIKDSVAQNTPITFPHQRVLLQQHIVLISFAVLFWAVVYLLTGQSVTMLAIKGLLSFNPQILFDGYNDARYGVTKLAFREGGMVGMGSLSMLATFFSISSVAAIVAASRQGKIPKIMLPLTLAASLAIAINSGARSELLDWGIRVTLIRSYFRRMSVYAILVGTTSLILLLIGFTLLTPKATVGGQGIASKFKRLAGNAFNDAVIMDEMHSKDRSGSAAALLPVDVYVSQYLYDGRDVPWYETPTIIGSMYYKYGWPGVMLSAVVTGSILALLHNWISRKQFADRELINRLALGSLCWSAPIAGIFNPRIFLSWFVTLVVLQLFRKRRTLGHFRQRAIPLS